MAFIKKRASRITAHFLSALMALQLASPAWAQTYQVRVPANISPEALLPELTVTPAQIDFGEVAKASSAMANATLTNTGDRAADISFSSLALPFDFNHDCVNPLPSGQNCSLNFSFTPTETGAHTGALTVSGGKLPIAIELVGTGGLPLAAIGEFKADSSADFGSISFGGSASRTFTFKNVGGLAAEGLYAKVSAIDGLTVSPTSTCGTIASPKQLLPNHSCTTTVSFGGNFNSKLGNATVTIEGAYQNSPQAVAMTGTLGVFNASGAWSTVYNASSVPTTDFLNFGNRTPGNVSSRDIYLRNVGTNGALHARFELVGDIDQFKITGIAKTGTSSGYTYHIGCGATVSADSASTSLCLTDDPSVSGSYKSARITIQHAPTRTGTATVSLRAISGDNGSVVPEQTLTFTGQGVFNPTGAWSTVYNASSVPTTDFLNFGNRTPGNVSARDIYLRNVGTNGALHARFELVGDIDQFKITGIAKTGTSSGYTYHIGCGATVSADSASTSLCLTDDPSVSGSYKSLRITIQHAPTRTGTATVSLRAIAGDNGSVMPESIVFTGQGVFNPTGAWSTVYNASSVPTTAFLNFGNRTPGNVSSRDIYLRNVGTNGALHARFELVGDIDQFKITGIAKTGTSSGYTYHIGCGATVSADSASTSLCLTDDPSVSGSYKSVRITIQHAPTRTGTATVSLRAIAGDNGSVVPEQTLTFTGTGL